MADKTVLNSVVLVACGFKSHSEYQIMRKWWNGRRSGLRIRRKFFVRVQVSPSAPNMRKWQN